MNILYIDHYAGSLSLGMEFRPFYLAREWKKLGHRVRIVGASFSHLRKNNPNVRRDFEIQSIDGIEFQWVKTGTYQGNGLARAKTLFEFCAKLSAKAGKIVKDFHPDVVIGSSTYPLDTYPAQRIRKLAGKGCRYIHEEHDMWPLTLIEKSGWDEKHPFIQLLAAGEKQAFSKSDAIVAVFAGVAEYMLGHGMQSMDKFTHIPNGVALEDWDMPEPVPSEHAEYFQHKREQNRFVIGYVGGHSASNAYTLNMFLDAAKLALEDDRLAFVCVGKGTEKKALQDRARAENISNLTFLPAIEKKQVPNLLNSCDALYCGAEPCSLYRFGVSMNKMYDYMMSGKPIINAVEARNNDVEEAGCGISTHAGRPDEIAIAAKTLCQMSPQQREEMGQRGRDWVKKNCAYDLLASRFLQVLTVK